MTRLSVRFAALDRRTGTRTAFTLPLAAALLAIGPHAARTVAARMGVVRPRGVSITVRAAQHACHNVPIVVELTPQPELGPLLKSAAKSGLLLVSADHRERLVCQVSAHGDGAQLTFLAPDLPRGAARTYVLQPNRGAKAPQTGVTVAPRGDDLDIFVTSGRSRTLFTTYTTHSGPNKPFFYPILTPDGDPMTRRWPQEQNTGESHDHIHHRGLWFTHSNVNGIDFWSEQGSGGNQKVGKTVNTGFDHIESGPVYGAFRARTEWRSPEGELIATDAREVKIVALPNGDRLLDFTITLTPVDRPLVFGDNKDGTFGLRLPDTLAPRPDASAHIAVPTGHILNSGGQKDGDAWGKPAEWVDYWGPIGGKTYGVAIFDAPANLRHPQTWHARDYGLFCANPFALHDFHLGAKGAGDLTVPINGTLTLRYGVLFHHGDAATSGVADLYAAWATPPDATEEN